MSYTEEVYERVVAQNPGEPEFHQAVKEVLDSLKVVIDKNEEEYRKLSILERLVEPERIISFKVPWIDDNGTVQCARMPSRSQASITTAPAPSPKRTQVVLSFQSSSRLSTSAPTTRARL